MTGIRHLPSLFVFLDLEGIGHASCSTGTAMDTVCRR